MMKEIRCPICNKLLFKGEAIKIEIKCLKCKSLLLLLATKMIILEPKKELLRGSN